MNLSTVSVKILVLNTASNNPCPVLTKNPVIKEVPLPVTPPNKRVVIGMAVNCVTIQTKTPTISVDFTVLNIPFLAQTPATKPMAAETMAYGIKVGAVIPKIKLVKTPTMIPPIGPVKAETNTVPIQSRKTGNLNSATIYPPTKLIAIAIGNNKILINDIFFMVIPPILGLAFTMTFCKTFVRRYKTYFR